MTMVFKDEDDAPLIPSTVDWRLDDKTNNEEIQPWTSLPAPASTMTFSVAGDKNVINDETNVKEMHVFGIRVDEGLPGEAYSELLYNVVNLIGPVGA